MEFSYTYEEFDYPETEKVLREMGEHMVNLMRSKLADNGTNASGNLSNSIQYLIQKDGQDFEVNVSLEEYWKYVENDTKPHWVSAKKLQDWIRVKPVLPEERNGKLPTVEELSYMIKWKIHEEGTKAQPFFWNSVEEAVADFEQRLGEALEKDIGRSVETMLMTIQF